MILLSDALRIMASNDPAGNFIPFDLTYITCNVTDGSGGRRVTVTGAALAGGAFGKKESPKKANHFLNGTRNIMVPGKPRPVKIHNLLITHFNGEEVII